MRVDKIRMPALDAQAMDSVRVRIAAVLIALFLIAPALPNGFACCSGTAAAIWCRYQGYLVPSRSTVFGLSPP